MGTAMTVLWQLHFMFAYAAAAMLVGSCYGGLAALLTPLTADLFGRKNLTANYGIMYTLYGLAGMIATPTIAFIRDNTGTYNPAFILGICFACIGGTFAFFMNRTVQRAKKADIANQIS